MVEIPLWGRFNLLGVAGVVAVFVVVLVAMLLQPA